MSEPDFITEPSRNILVYRRCDVLVVGGGPAGCAAAVSAARMGADVVLVERYGHLGGMSTGGFVLWIDRMTDCEGRQVVPGIANDILERIPDDDVLGHLANYGDREMRTRSHTGRTAPMPSKTRPHGRPRWTRRC